MKKLLIISLCLFAFTSFSQTPEGYNALGKNLDGICWQYQPNRFTIFRGIDLNFANSRLERYLQDDGLTIDDKSVKYQKGKSFTVKYQSRVSSGARLDYATIYYWLETSKTKPPYYKTDDGTCDIITKVKITGAADIIIRLFMRYWHPEDLVLENIYKPGEIASYQIMGDRVVLRGEQQRGICSITIEKGDIDFDYYETYNIVAEPKQSE